MVQDGKDARIVAGEIKGINWLLVELDYINKKLKAKED